MHSWCESVLLSFVLNMQRILRFPFRQLQSLKYILSPLELWHTITTEVTGRLLTG